MDHVGWLDRVERALEELGWSGREFCRRAGLKNEAQFAVTSSRIRTKERAQPSAMVVDGLTGALVRAGYSDSWGSTADEVSCGETAAASPPGARRDPPVGAM